MTDQTCSGANLLRVRSAFELLAWLTAQPWLALMLLSHRHGLLVMECTMPL